jgi:hypothetical protein
MTKTVATGLGGLWLMTLLPVLCAAQQAPAEPLSKAAVELKACGPGSGTDFNQHTDKHSHAMGEPSADKALVYVMRPTMFGMAIQTKLAVDGDWKGVNRGNTYFYFTLPPGEHYFCSTAENKSVLTLSVEAGKTYYLQQGIRPGFIKAQNELEVMDADKAKDKLKNLNLSTWDTK